MTMSSYEPLTIDSAVALVKKLGLLTETDTVSANEIGDGNLNYVFHIKGTEKSLIVKQALPYAKVVGESWPLTLERADIENRALRLQGTFAPDYTPKVYYSDKDLAITIMEDLSHLTIARTGLIQGEDYPLIARHTGEFIARTLYGTSDFALGPQEKKKLQHTFSNPELCDITEGLVFTDPFFDAGTNDFEESLRTDVEKLWQDDELKLHAAQLKRLFLTAGDALLHGDLHTGSIFASPAETKIIDPEFAFYGPFGFDIAHFTANLFMNVLSREEGRREPLYEHIVTVWDVFNHEFSRLWNEQNTEAFAKTEGYLEWLLADIFEQAAGFMGLEMIRRTIGLAHVKDLDGIVDDQQRLQAKRHSLSLGAHFVKERASYSSADQLVAAVKEALQ
ncbi:S-methyl-5-thioribose kinase [Domibacillus sp. PGB-M46]|nr:S-methyl-5-thioribose kinase [Domibacillus sp. PGB-M46]MCI2255085.1 S-methyl-5-thioribose kinase [Domibacillus sp. PGB-M46]